MPIIFITGIDTGIGKTYVTGLLARYLKQNNASVTTMKLVQTGCQGISEDIKLHRQLMQEPLSDWDQQGTTCPYVFAYPASPHLAARLENRTIACDVIDRAVNTLSDHFDYLLIEGVGGLCVPLTSDYTVLDYLKDRTYPCLVVTSPKLGSINHTLLTIDTLQAHSLPLLGLCYSVAVSAPPEITADTRDLFQKHYPSLPLVTIPPIDPLQPYKLPDFSILSFP